MACKQAAMSWIFNGAGSFEKLPVQEDGPRTCHSERSEESQNECAEAKHIKIQDFSYLTTFHCNSIFALLLSFPKSLNFLLSPPDFAGEPCEDLWESSGLKALLLGTKADFIQIQLHST